LTVKRAFDLFASLFGLVLSLPLFLVVGFLIRLDSRGPIFFRQERVGKGLQPFTIYKFRTMFHEVAVQDRAITPAGDPRVTRLGRVLRKLKFDELPQLFNVLKGDMSLVGPRPEVPRYVKLFRSDYEEILKIRPGITDLASLKYRDEASLLANATDPDALYLQQVLPDKIRLAKEYVRRSSLAYDIRLIFKTIFGLAG